MQRVPVAEIRTLLQDRATAFFDVPKKRRLFAESGIRVGNTIYLTGSEKDGRVRVYRVWALDATTGMAVQIGDEAYEDAASANMLMWKAASHAWPAAVVAHIVDIAKSVHHFNRALGSGKGPIRQAVHRNRRSATKLAHACGAALTWGRDDTKLRWTDALGDTLVELPSRMAEDMGFRI